MDVDVELIKPLDGLTELDGYMGFEKEIDGQMQMCIRDRDEDETIVLIRKNGEETIALIFNCSDHTKEFKEYAQKQDLLTEKAFDGKVEAFDAAVIVL